MGPVCRRIGFAHQTKFGEPGQDLTQLLGVFAFSERQEGVEPSRARRASMTLDGSTRDDGVPGIQPDLDVARPRSSI